MPDPTKPYSAGMYAQTYRDELSEMFNRHQAIFADLNKRISLGTTMLEIYGQGGPGQAPLNQHEAQAMADAHVNEQNTADLYAKTNKQHDVSDLLGRADFYGIRTEGKTPQQIAVEVEARRGSVRADLYLDSVDNTFMQNAADVAQTGIAALGIGTLEGVSRLAQHLPFAGKLIAKANAVHSFDKWVAKLDEGFTADTYEEDQYGYNAGKFAGSLIPYWWPGNLAMKVAGGIVGAEVAGAAGVTATKAITKMALQSSLATAMLDAGGEDRSWEEKALVIGMGGLMGAGIEGFTQVASRFAGINKRVSDSFSTKLLSPGGDALPPTGRNLDMLPAGQYDVAPAPPRTESGAFMMGEPGAPPFLGFSDEVAPAAIPTEHAPLDAVSPRPNLSVSSQERYVPDSPHDRMMHLLDQASEPFTDTPMQAPEVGYEDFLAERGYTPEEFSPVDWEAAHGRPIGPQRMPSAAEHEAANLTKQATILESPAVADMSTKLQFDDFDVIRASLATDPSEISIVRNIGDVDGTIRKLTAESAGQKLMPHDFRVVEFQGKKDILIGAPGSKLSNQMVGQYQKYGMIKGMKAITDDGVEVVVKGFTKDGLVRYSSVGGRADDFVAHPESLMPRRHTQGNAEALVPDAPQLYQRFKQFAMQDMLDNSVGAGLPIFDWMDSQASALVPSYMEQFLDQIGIQNDVARHAYKSYFSTLRVKEFEGMVEPALRTHARQATAEATALVNEAKAAGQLPMHIDEVAEAKGFSFQRIGQHGYELVDDSGLRVAVDSEQDALAALKAFDRETADIMPPGTIPETMFETVPGGSHPGTSSEPWMHADVEDALSLEGVENMTDEFAALEEGDILESMPLTDDAVPPFVEAPATGGGGGRPPRPPRRSKRTASEFEDNLNRAGGVALHESINHIFDNFWIKAAPMRNAFGMIADAITEHGVEGGHRVYELYNRVSAGYTSMNNEMRPLMHELGDITTEFSDRFHIRSGNIIRVLRTPEELAGLSLKSDVMRKYGYTAKDVAAQSRYEGFISKVLGRAVGEASQPGDAAAFMTYIDELRNFQLDRTKAGKAHDLAMEFLPEHLKFLGEDFKFNHMDVRELNANRLAAKLTRSVIFKEQVLPHWTEMRDQFGRGDIPHELKNFTNGWLDIVRRGRDVKHDAVIGGVTQVLNTMRIPATRADVSAAFGGITGNIYRASLGIRPDALLREAMQPLMAWVKTGGSHIPEAYGAFLKGGEVRELMEQRALKYGWLEPGRARLALADVFEESPLITEAIPQGSGAALERYRTFATSREKYAKAVDGIWNMMPKAARHGIQDTAIDPLKLYTKVTEMGKVVAGNGAFNKGMEAFEHFQAGKLDIPKLMDSVGASFYPKALTEELLAFVKAGDAEGFAGRYASEVVADSMMRVGGLEQPQLLQSAGTAGRFGMMFGNFSLGTIHWFNGILQAGSTGVAAAAATRYATIAAGLVGAEALTGFKFHRWLWHNSLWFSGGPAVGVAANAAQAAQGITSIAGGYQPSFQQRMAMDQFTPGNMGAGLLKTLNPYQGLVRGYDAMNQAAQTPNFPYYAGRYIVTGEKGDRYDRSQFYNNLDTSAPPPAADVPGIPPFLVGPGSGAQ